MRPRHRLASLAIVAATLILAACSSGSGDARASRTIAIDMRDNAYSPSHVTVQAGETVRFEFHNVGKARHDAFLGTERAQMDHEVEMREMGKMHHDGGDAVTADPGKASTLTHTFATGEHLLIGCHEPGHYTAGMKVTVVVS